MSNELAPVKQALTPSGHLKPLLDKMQETLKSALADRLTVGQFQSMALAAYSKNGKLWDCTDESVLRCMLDVAVIGLEPDTVRGHAYLIPYKDQCTLQIGYKGLVHVVTRNGDALKIDAHVVYANDIFRIEYGFEEKLIHQPFIPKKKTDQRGDKIGAYSFVKLRNGENSFLYMNMVELDEVRAKADAKSFAWKDFEDEMYKKTVFRRHSKMLPLSEDTRNAIEKDIEFENKLDPAKEIKVESSKLFAKVEATEQAAESPKLSGNSADLGTATAGTPAPKKKVLDPQKEVKATPAEKSNTTKSPEQLAAHIATVNATVAAFKKLGVAVEILETYMRAPKADWNEVTLADLKDIGKKLKASGEEGVKAWLIQFEKDEKVEAEIGEIFGAAPAKEEVIFGND